MQWCCLDSLRIGLRETMNFGSRGIWVSNIRAMYRDSNNMGEALWERFNQKDKDMHAWYYRSIGSVLFELDRYDAYSKYMEFMEKVFGHT